MNNINNYFKCKIKYSILYTVYSMRREKRKIKGEFKFEDGSQLSTGEYTLFLYYKENDEWKQLAEKAVTIS